jgi:release factor glutamine methyltransferase
MHDLLPIFERAQGLDRRSVPDGQWRRGLRSAVHFLSYHLILKRRTTRRTRAAGFRMVVRPTVFHPRYFLTAAENARANGFENLVTAMCSDLLSAVAPRDLFDVIITSPPSFPGEPRDLADRAWHAGPDYRDIAALFDQARERLAPDGRMYILLSSDSDLDLFSTLITRARFRARLAAERSLLVESFLIYSLQPP